jgi:hypothetical protein
LAEVGFEESGEGLVAAGEAERGLAFFGFVVDDEGFGEEAAFVEDVAAWEGEAGWGLLEPAAGEEDERAWVFLGADEGAEGVGDEVREAADFAGDAGDGP